MLKSITLQVLEAVERSPFGIAHLDVLDGLKLCGKSTLKTILSRLNKSNRIVRLKRGVYASCPLVDAFATGQAMFKGYLGFSTALYLHTLTSEVPFTVFVVTVYTSSSKLIGQYEFKAVALKEKAVGFECKDGYVVSTRAKTLFDCIYFPDYSVEPQKLVDAFKEACLTAKEWKEFDGYVKKFVKEKKRKRFYSIKKMIRS